MTSNKDELTLKEFIEVVNIWFTYFLSKWKIIVLIGVTGSALGYAKAYFDKPIYVAELTLALEDKGGPSAYSGIASQFGIDIGGSSGGAFSGDNNI